MSDYFYMCPNCNQMWAVPLATPPTNDPELETPLSCPDCLFEGIVCVTYKPDEKTEYKSRMAWLEHCESVLCDFGIQIEGIEIHYQQLPSVRMDDGQFVGQGEWVASVWEPSINKETGLDEGRLVEIEGSASQTFDECLQKAERLEHGF